MLDPICYGEAGLMLGALKPCGKREGAHDLLLKNVESALSSPPAAIDMRDRDLPARGYLINQDPGGLLVRAPQRSMV